MKKCSKCGVERELILFSKRKKSKDGYNYECKLCRKEYRKNLYLKNKDRELEKSNEYNKTHKEERAISGKILPK